jgi:HK97 family phage major capsid protein
MSQALQALYAKRAAITGDLDEVRAKYTADPSKGLLERVDNLKRSTDSISKEIVAELGQAHARGEVAEENGSGVQPTTIRTRGNARDEALRSVEARGKDGTLDPASGDRLVSVIERDKSGVDAEYIRAVSDPDYEAAFGRIIESPHPILTPDEARAVQRAQSAMRSLNISTPSAGGYAIPLSLDPTIILTSSGVVNPLRSLATVSTISTSEWAGITSAGVSAAFVTEGTEATDNSPTLAQPKIKPQKAQALVKFTHEAGQDWANLQPEMGKLFDDARATLEAEKFAVGTGTNEPAGLITGATETVTTAAASVIANADVYALGAAVPSRFQPNSTFLSTLTTANAIYVKSGPGSTEPSLFNEDRDRLVGRPWKELSTMSSATTAGANPLVIGDIAAGFRIVDRVGASVELIPNLLGTNGLPNGYRALYMYWRTGSAVVDPKAIRALKMHA